MPREVVLRKIAMIRPSLSCIYAPSRIETEPKIIPYQEFLRKYADYPREIPVSFDEDGISNPTPTTAYGYGLDVWWIVC